MTPQEFRFWPSRTLAWYMARTFLVRSAAVLAALLIVLLTLDLLGESGDILAYPGNGEAQLWHYAALRGPQIIAFLLPFSVLLGTLITLVTLNQNSEVIAMKAGGVSAHQILAPLVLASLGIAALSFTFNERVVTRSTATLNAWQDVDYGKVPVSRGTPTNIWVRDGDDIVHADQVIGKGSGVHLTGVTVYDRDGGELHHIFTAPSARAKIGPDGAIAGWTAPDVTMFDVVSGTESKMPQYMFGAHITPDQFTLADVNADEHSLSELGAAVNDLKSAGRPTGPLETGWWHKISGPLSSVLMPLLAGVAAFGLARSGALFLRAVIGMALGFTYFVADNFAVAMGNLGAYPPFLAAWAPFLLFLLIGETVLIRTEE
ncbi:LPS export ABC transporter permease LptG [Sphingomonas abietis]|uniref:LPS export ABC transporter permease LptG n=1 Tax=Sphingomonas abietis TaxID=3012344 RepID=A0ABY7NKF3_9SPHN|nr:LPS export ABC transporter permease LptG [Sphingomonas abietis]WBO22015.1 LPS export ABC transporter permease LptG [Sphingomonas abietis]